MISCQKHSRIKTGVTGSIFEPHPQNFQKMCIFWRCRKDIFCYLLWFQFRKKCQSLPVHPTVVLDLFYVLFCSRYQLCNFSHDLFPATPICDNQMSPFIIYRWKNMRIWKISNLIWKQLQWSQKIHQKIGIGTSVICIDILFHLGSYKWAIMFLSKQVDI